jgi:hypothetical protein
MEPPTAIMAIDGHRVWRCTNIRLGDRTRVAVVGLPHGCDVSLRDYRGTRGLGVMRYFAAGAAFVIAYFIATLAYGKLTPRAWIDDFRQRPWVIGLLVLIVCPIAAVSAFRIVGFI